MTLNPYNSIYSEYVSSKIHHKSREQKPNDEQHKEGQHNQNNKLVSNKDKLQSLVEDKVQANEVKKIIGLGARLDIRV